MTDAVVEALHDCLTIAETAARQSFEQAWADAVASAERVLAPIRARVRWEEA